MLWAACCLGFFGFLRSGEFVAPAVGEFDPGQHLSFADISVDSSSNPRVLCIRIKQSKTDPFRQGVTIVLGRTDAQLCPMAAKLAYLALWGPGEGPLLRYEDHRPPTRQRLVSALREAVFETGFQPSCYAGHSFRIGAATTAAASVASLWLPLKHSVVGRVIEAHQLHIRLPQPRLAGISRRLASHGQS